MNNKRFIPVLLVLSIALSLISCIRSTEYVEQTYSAMYRVDSIVRIGGRFMPRYTPDPAVEQEIREFYKRLDTSLVYKGYIPTTVFEPNYKNWCALDWQVTEIDVICRKDWDETHPAGSSVKEKLFISYWYMYRHLKKQLSDIRYGEFMLCDFYPAVELLQPFSLHFNNVEDRAKYDHHRKTSPDDPMLELHVKDAFGRHFKVPF